MGAGINSILAHGVEPIHIDPFAAQAKAMQLGEYYAKTNLQKQQAEEARLKNVTAQRGIDAEAALSQAIAKNTVQDPETGQPVVNHDAVIQQVAASGFPARADTYAVGQRAAVKQNIENHQNQLKIVGERNKAVGNALQAATNAPDDEIADTFDTQRAQLIKDYGSEVAAKVPSAAMLMAKGGPNAVRAFAQTEGAAVMDVDKQIEAQQKQADYALRLNQFKLESMSKGMDNRKKALELASNLYATAPDQQHWDAATHTVQSDPYTSDAVKQEILSTFGPAWSQEAQKQAGAVMQTPAERETGRHNRELETGQAATRAQTQSYQGQEVANQNARLQLERSKEAREQQIYNQTYGPGANPALQGVEPKLRTAAASAAQKAATEYATASNAADEMRTIIDLARGGNKIAYAYAPTTGVLTINSGNGVKRVNMAEISQYGGAGSLLDRVQGYLGKQATGASIPKDILDDMEKLHDSLGGNAAKNYNDKLNAVNQNYRSNFQPVPMGSKDGPKTVNTKAEYDALPSGTLYIDAQDNKQYKKR